MTKSNFGCRFHNLEYFEVRFSFIFVEFIINSRASLQNFVENFI